MSCYIAISATQSSGRLSAFAVVSGSPLASLEGDEKTSYKDESNLRDSDWPRPSRQAASNALKCGMQVARGGTLPKDEEEEMFARNHACDSFWCVWLRLHRCR